MTVYHSRGERGLQEEARICNLGPRWQPILHGPRDEA